MCEDHQQMQEYEAYLDQVIQENEDNLESYEDQYLTQIAEA